MKNKLKKIIKNIQDHDHRSLFTVIGCIIGFILGVYLVSGNNAFVPIIGHSQESLILKIVAVALSTGTGGNLFSYIGGCIDIMKKIFTTKNTNNTNNAKEK